MALNLLFPQHCVGCGKEGAFICASCRISFPAIKPPICPLCGRPQSSGLLCPNCVSWQANIDGIRSPFRFEGVVRQAVHQLKYRNLRALIPQIGLLMHEYLREYPVQGDVFVPVPIHKNRLKERGYNQSFLIAKELGKLCELPVDDSILIKTRHTEPQARTSSVSERKNNVSGAYTHRDIDLSGKKVILIDDVSTSCATLDACAGVLKEAGVDSVWGLTLAREI